MRSVASLGGYVASYDGSGVQVHGHPPDGAVELTVTASREEPWTLSLRSPGTTRVDRIFTPVRRP